jgi:hypothetical protein
VSYAFRVLEGADIVEQVYTAAPLIQAWKLESWSGQEEFNKPWLLFANYAVSISFSIREFFWWSQILPLYVE